MLEKKTGFFTARVEGCGEHHARQKVKENNYDIC